MKLPNGERAIVEDNKLKEYVLNPLHPVGRHHAFLFKELLGIELENFDFLKTKLLDAARNKDVILQTETPHGRKYLMRFEIAGYKGTKLVNAVWIIDEDKSDPRLVTCFVD